MLRLHEGLHLRLTQNAAPAVPAVGATVCARSFRRTLLAKEQRRIRSEYEERLRDLERERHGVEEDRAQARPYDRLSTPSFTCR